MNSNLIAVLGKQKVFGQPETYEYPLQIIDKVTGSFIAGVAFAKRPTQKNLKKIQSILQFYLDSEKLKEIP